MSQRIKQIVYSRVLNKAVNIRVLRRYHHSDDHSHRQKRDGALEGVGKLILEKTDKYHKSKRERGDIIEG